MHMHTLLVALFYSCMYQISYRYSCMNSYEYVIQCIVSYEAYYDTMPEFAGPMDPYHIHMHIIQAV